MAPLRAINDNYWDDPQAAVAALAALIPDCEGDFFFRPPLVFEYREHIHIGVRTFINSDFEAIGSGEVWIGDDVLIGPHARLYTPNHPLDPAVRAEGWEIGLPIRIEDKAWLGGFAGANLRDSLYQDVVIPPATKQVVLSGYYQVLTDETSGGVYDSATVALSLTSGAVIATALQVSNLTPLTTWAQFHSTVASTGAQDLSGLTVRVRFSSRNDGAKPTSFFFDTIALTATHGCP